jgi:hypothetical protein
VFECKWSGKPKPDHYRKTSVGQFARELQQQIDGIAAEYGAPSFEPHVTLLGGVHASEAQVLSVAAELAGRLQVPSDSPGRGRPGVMLVRSDSRMDARLI